MNIVSRETWDDGTVVEWSVAVHETQLSKELLAEWYDRDCKTNSDCIKEGGTIRAFIVDAVKVRPDEERACDENEPIAANAFLGIGVGQTLVLLMNHKEYAEKVYGAVSPDFSSYPTLINIQDCGFDVEVVD